MNTIRYLVCVCSIVHNWQTPLQENWKKPHQKCTILPPLTSRLRKDDCIHNLMNFTNCQTFSNSSNKLPWLPTLTISIHRCWGVAMKMMISSKFQANHSEKICVLCVCVSKNHAKNESYCWLVLKDISTLIILWQPLIWHYRTGQFTMSHI